MSAKRILVVALLFLLSLFLSWVIYSIDSGYRVLASLLIILFIAVAAKFLKVTPKEMGIDASTLKQGIYTALPFMLTIMGVMGVVYIFKPGVFLDSRYDQGLASMFYSILFILPLTTVLLEELFFRGLFYGYLSGVTSVFSAIIIPSFAFGLWHLYTSKNVTLDVVSISPILVSAGVVVATTVAGVFFVWLRIRGNNIITPMLVHWSINATGVVLSYLAWQQK